MASFQAVTLSTKNDSSVFKLRRMPCIMFKMYMYCTGTYLSTFVWRNLIKIPQWYFSTWRRDIPEFGEKSGKEKIVNLDNLILSLRLFLWSTDPPIHVESYNITLWELKINCEKGHGYFPSNKIHKQSGFFWWKVKRKKKTGKNWNSTFVSKTKEKRQGSDNQIFQDTSTCDVSKDTSNNFLHSTTINPIHMR